MTNTTADKIATLRHQIETGAPIVLIYDPTDKDVEEIMGDCARVLGRLYMDHGAQAVKMTFADDGSGKMMVEIGPIRED